MNDLSTLVALLLTASGGAFIREVLIGIAKLRAGVAGSERGRRGDVVKQRDDAVKAQAALKAERTAETKRADTAEHRADVLDRHISDLREFCLAHGTPLSSLPPRPSF